MWLSITQPRVHGIETLGRFRLDSSDIPISIHSVCERSPHRVNVSCAPCSRLRVFTAILEFRVIKVDKLEISDVQWYDDVIQCQHLVVNAVEVLLFSVSGVVKLFYATSGFTTLPVIFLHCEYCLTFVIHRFIHSYKINMIFTLKEYLILRLLGVVQDLRFMVCLSHVYL